MSYQLEPNETVPNGIKRIATEEVDSALAQLRDAPEGWDEAIHEARKSFKKIRAVLRLVRDEVGPDVYKKENVCYRDAGRLLSDVRDSAVMVETVDLITDHFDDHLAQDAFDSVRQRLQETHESFREKIVEHEAAIAEVIETIEDARSRIINWPVEQDNFAALYGGLRRVYKRGRKRLADAYEEPAPERFHEWRKRVKYLWYHIRILQPIWPDILDELADQLHDLSDYLGDDHDLHELRQLLTGRPELTEDESEQEALLGLIDRYRLELEEAAQPLGERIYAEEPAEFVERIADYWLTWRKQL